MPDDILRDAIETSRTILDSSDFETQGKQSRSSSLMYSRCTWCPRC